MADRIQQRRDTAARWAQFNPILLEGEVGYVTDDPNQYKIGDGVHAWNDLPLRGFDGTLVHTTGDSTTSVMSQKAVTDEFAKLRTAGYIYAGIATATTNPGTPVEKVFYAATTAGTYTNFGNKAVNNGITILSWNGTSWTSNELISIKSEVGSNENAVMSQKIVSNLLRGEADSITNNVRNPYTYLGSFKTWTEVQAELDKLHNTGGESGAGVSDDTKIGEFRVLLDGRNLLVRNWVQNWSTGVFTQTVEGSIRWNGETMEQSLQTNTYERTYNGGSGWSVWQTASSSGGNMILDWKTDAATTRKQVTQDERKAGMMISYKNASGEWINEQYVGTSFDDTSWAADANWQKIGASAIELAQDFSTEEGSEDKAISQKAVSQITSALIEPIKCDAVKYIADKYVRTATLEDCVGNKLAVFEVKKGNTYIIRGFNTPIAKAIGANTGLYSYYRDIDLTDNISYIGSYVSQGTNSYIRKCIFRPTEDGYIALNNVSDIRDDYVWLYRLTNSIVDNLSIDKFDEEILKSDRYRKIEKSETVDDVDYYELTVDKVYLARINRTILTGTYAKSFLAWYTDTAQTNRVGLVIMNTADKAELYVDILINPYSGSYLNNCAYLKKYDTEIELYEVLNYEDYLKTNVIICEGDSLTTGLAGDGHSYPAKLLELIRSNYPKYKYAVFNGGLTGASAQTIAMMAGAMSYELSNGVEIAANSYSTDENFVDLLGKPIIAIPKGQENYVSLFNDKFNKLTINVAVTKIYNDSDTSVTCNAGEKLYLRRIKSRYNLYLPPKVICIYLGRNDKYSDVDSAISHMINCTKKIIERYNTTNYVVISQFDFWDIFNDDEKMSKYEKAFDSEFNKHYINFRWYARNKWFTYSGLEPTENDQSAMQLGRAPKSIYASGDLIHLSATGYDFLGELVYKKLIELNVLPIKVK